MKLSPLLFVVATLGLTSCISMAVRPRAARPAQAAFVGTVLPARDDNRLQAGDPIVFNVIAGWVANKGWVKGERAKRLIHKGDRVRLAPAGVGADGEITLTTSGSTGAEEEQEGDGSFWGLSLDGKVVAAGSSTHQAICPLGVWHSTGSPAPRWAIGTEVSANSQTDREAIEEWLKSRGVSRAVIASVVVDQIVKADINGDKRDEVFIAFRTPDVGSPEAVSKGEGGRERPSKNSFSYLIMRYLPSRSRHARTVVLSNVSWVMHAVLGFCDLDRDGWAEVVSQDNWTDY